MILVLYSACCSASQVPTIDPTQTVKLLAGEYSTTITQKDVTRLDSLEPDIAANIGVVNTAGPLFSLEKGVERGVSLLLFQFMLKI